METAHLDTKRTHIISMLRQETNEKVLNNIELLLLKNDVSPIDGYSADMLKNAVLHSSEDIRNGRVVTIEEMRRKHRCFRLPAKP